AERSRPPAAHRREHAPLLRGRPRAAAPDPAADDGARPQPGRRRSGARPRGAAAADAVAHGAARARDARRGRAGAQAIPPRPRALRLDPTTGAKVDFNKLTLKSQEAVAAAQELARRMGNPELYPEHLTLALLDQELPQQLVPDPAELRAQAEASLRAKPSTQGAQQQPQVSAAVSRVFDQASDEAKRMEDDYVSTEHLLLALDVVPREQLEAKIAAVRGGQRVTSQDPEGTYQALEKFGRVLTEVQNAAGELILFIDELHTIVGAGAAEGAVDAANMLKPMLARGELRAVGATTLDEYRKHIEKDAALERRFQPVLVGEPSVADTIAILRGLKERYEVHHGVRIADDAIVAAALLADRYITDRFMPDKAIDLIDEAASRLKIEIDSMPVEIDSVRRRIVQLEIEQAAMA